MKVFCLSVRLGQQGEARDWQKSMKQVNREFKINGIRDASVKDEQEEANVMNMVELLSSPHDHLLDRLDLSTNGILRVKSESHERDFWYMAEFWQSSNVAMESATPRTLWFHCFAR